MAAEGEEGSWGTRIFLTNVKHQIVSYLKQERARPSSRRKKIHFKSVTFKNNVLPYSKQLGTFIVDKI